MACAVLAKDCFFNVVLLLMSEIVLQLVPRKAIHVLFGFGLFILIQLIQQLQLSSSLSSSMYTAVVMQVERYQ